MLKPATNVGMPTSFSQLIAGSLALIDVGVECVGCSSAGSGGVTNSTAVASSRNLYLRRVTVVGFHFAVRVFNSNATSVNQTVERYTLASERAAAPGGGIVYVNELSVPVPNQNQKSDSFIDGRLIQAGRHGAVVADITHGSLTANRHGRGDDANRIVRFDGLCDKHGWGDNFRFPSHGTAGALNVKQQPYNAVGDGVHDDTIAIQHAINDAAAAAAATAESATTATPTKPRGNVVFFPRGAYRTSASLAVPAGVQVVGLSRHLTTLVSDDTLFAPKAAAATFAIDVATTATTTKNTTTTTSRSNSSNSINNVGDPNYNSPPILEFAVARDTANNANTSSTGGNGGGGLLETVFFGMTLLVPVNNAKVNVSAWVFKSGVSNQGNFNVARQIWQTRDTVCGEWWSARCSRRFYEPPPLAVTHSRIEGETATLRLHVFFQEDGNNDGALSTSPFNRKLLVNGTRQPIAIYQLNGEHGVSTAFSEFVNTSGVQVYVESLTHHRDCCADTHCTRR